MTYLFDLPELRELLESSRCAEFERLPAAAKFYRDPRRQTEREYFQSIFARLPDGPYKRESQKRLLSQDLAHHLGAWYEWMVYDWLDGLGKTVCLQPSVDKGTHSRSRPDFLVQSSDGLQIFVEVTMVQESAKDEELHRTGVWWPHTTHTCKTMGERLEKKMGQHRGISKLPGSAYVICLCLDSDLINSNSVRTYLQGTDSFAPSVGLHSARDGAVFERDHKGIVYEKHRDVSALLVASKKRTSVEDGFKLKVELIQNPYATTPIRATEFGQLRRYVVVSETDTRYYMKWIHTETVDL